MPPLFEKPVILGFWPRNIVKREFAIRMFVRCHSVCLSVCPSITLVSNAVNAYHMIEGCFQLLSRFCNTISGFTPTIALKRPSPFDSAISLKRCKMWIAFRHRNYKIAIYTGFPLVPKLMTSNDLERCNGIISHRFTDFSSFCANYVPVAEDQIFGDETVAQRI